MSTVTVLVVEDEALLRLALITAFADAGLHVVAASNAREAIAIIEVNPEIRAVFSDIYMPGGIDGIELVEHIRERWPRMTLLLTSGAGGLQQDDIPTGARFFPKPYEMRQIIATIRVAMEELAF